MENLRDNRAESDRGAALLAIIAMPSVSSRAISYTPGRGMFLDPSHCLRFVHLFTAIWAIVIFQIGNSEGLLLRPAGPGPPNSLDPLASARWTGRYANHSLCRAWERQGRTGRSRGICSVSRERRQGPRLPSPSIRQTAHPSYTAFRVF